MKKNYITKICAIMLATPSLTAFAIESIPNPSLGDVPVLCKSEIEYKVKLPATIDLKLDDTGDDTLYKCDYDIVVSGVANGKWFHIDADDIELENENGKKLIVPNRMRANIDDEWQNPYTHKETITEDGVTILGTARINSKDVQPGNYNGMANYKFNLVEHKHVYEETTGKNTKGNSYTGVYWYRDGDEQYRVCSECGHIESKPVNSMTFNNITITGYSISGTYTSRISRQAGTNGDTHAYGSSYYDANYTANIYPYYLYNGEWYKVTYIASRAFCCKSVPSNFGKYYFKGTMAEWNAIPKASNWNYGLDGSNRSEKACTRIYCTDGTINY